MDDKQEVLAQNNNTVSTQPGYLLTVNVPSHPFGKSTIGIFITTEDGYTDHAYIPTRGNPSWTFKVPPNQGNSVQVCVDSGPQTKENCHMYKTNGSNMSVSLPAISGNSTSHNDGSGSNSNNKSNDNNDNSKSHHGGSDTGTNNNRSHIAETSHTNFNEDNSRNNSSHHGFDSNSSGNGGSNNSNNSSSTGSNLNNNNNHDAPMIQFIGPSP